ncbi:MAG: adenylate/guanylate cyclase domain-containing protein [Desulfobacula sp.]|jgi:class 3 adenylate cyclase
MNVRFNPESIFHDTLYRKSENINLKLSISVAGLFVGFCSIVWIIIGFLTHHYMLVATSVFVLGVMMFCFYNLKQNRLRLVSHFMLLTMVFWIVTVMITFQGNERVSAISVHHWLIFYVVGMQFLLINENICLIIMHFFIAFIILIVFEFNIITFQPLISNPEADAVSLVVTPALIVASIIFVGCLFISKLQKAEAGFHKTNRQLDDLLKNLLPTEIADRIIKEGKTFAEAFSECSIMFAKIIGLEELYSGNSYEIAIKQLDHIFSEFDTIASQYKLERIKTIGDSYMVVAGVPQVKENHALTLCQFALAIKQKFSTEKVGVRIGINSGPIVAGLIGKTGLIYDLWGDTVNVASRMESTGEVGQIQISAATKEILGNRFIIEERGKIKIKGKGLMDTFFIKGYKTITKQQI